MHNQQDRTAPARLCRRAHRGTAPTHAALVDNRSAYHWRRPLRLPLMSVLLDGRLDVQISATDGSTDTGAARNGNRYRWARRRGSGSRFSPAAITNASIAASTWTFCACLAMSSPRHRPGAPRAGWPGRGGGPKTVDRVPFIAGEPGRRGRSAAGFPKRLPTADGCGRKVVFPRGCRCLTGAAGKSFSQEAADG